MNSKVFRRVAGLLGLKAKDIAEGTNYALSTVKAYSAGFRAVPPEAEEWILKQLRASRDDDAVQVVLKTCCENSADTEED